MKITEVVKEVKKVSLELTAVEFKKLLTAYINESADEFEQLGITDEDILGLLRDETVVNKLMDEEDREIATIKIEIARPE